MSTALRKRISTFLLLVYASAAFGLQAGHRHDLVVRTGDDTEVRSHDCGANERHLPAGTDMDCALCQRVLHFVSIGSSQFFSAAETAEIIPPQVTRFTFRDSRTTFFFRRGPPVLS